MSASPSLSAASANAPILFAGFQLRRDQTYLVDTGVAHDVNRSRHLRENDGLIAFDESHLFSSQLENIVQARSQGIPGSVAFVDFQFVVVEDLNTDGLRLDILLVLLIRRRLGHQSVQPLWRLWRDPP